MCGDGLSVIGISDDDAGETRLQIHQVGGQTQHGHNLTGDCNVKAVLAWNSLCLSAKPIDNVTELTVIHIDSTLPGDLFRIDAEGVALLNVVVQHGSQQIVGGTDGVEITGEMEIDVLHGDNLGIAASGCSALDAENRTERGLTKRDDRILADLAQTVGKTDRSSGFTFTGWSRSDGGDENKLSLFGEFLQSIEIQFGFVFAIVFHSIIRDAERCGNGINGLQRCFLCDFNVSFICHNRPPV